MKILTTAPVGKLFRALSDSTRLRIMHLLLGGELCVCDLVAALQVPQPTASRHLAYLRRSGLVLCRREGQWCHYRIAPAKSKFHAQLLACLQACCGDVANADRDLKRLATAKRGCCG